MARCAFGWRGQGGRSVVPQVERIRCGMSEDGALQVEETTGAKTRRWELT